MADKAQAISGGQQKTALVVGATGITGLNLIEEMQRTDWPRIIGLARKPDVLAAYPGVEAVAADLLDADGLREKVRGLGVTHVFFGSWLRQDSEEKNCEVNGRMLANLLDALADQKSHVEHVALVTGGKNYFGSFEDSGKYPVVTPYREEQARKPGLNFYYTQEDILFERAAAHGFTWAVHRPQTIIGYAVGNAMNMAVTLAVYATICKETGRPFVFPGSQTIYRGICDATDARMLAKQMLWAAGEKAAANKAFNVNNGDVFRWDWMWQQIADYFGLEPAEYRGEIDALADQMREAAGVWREIAAKHGLVESDVDRLASWWHTDSDLSRPFETITDMSRSRKLGFADYAKSSDCFVAVFDRLRAERIIP